MNETEEEAPTLFRDPRKSGPLIDKGRERIYVFSHPDPEEAKQWAESHGIPKKFWEEDRKRVRVQEPFITVALKLPKAPKKLIEELLPETPRKTV